MMRIAVISLALLALTAHVAHGDPDPRRKVIVLEYRAASAALPGVAARVVSALARQTSLGVLGQDQARAMYGDHLDQVLVKCAGDAVCVARIGQKVGAAEVILVGVSELGDVILTMQRIDVAGRTVTGRIADSLAAGAAPSDAQITDYVNRLLPPGDFLRFGVIDIVANLSGAAVTVGGQSRGMTPIEALKLPAPASYDIRVEKPGYVPFTTRVALPPDGEVKVEAELSRRGADAWYQRWYVLAAAGVIVAGAGGTAIYFGTRDTGPAGDGKLHVTGSVH
ncbi:MAG: PEGA domain-containing protein [Deltaproteobacteria bacterium]|nr:MAG: PEGA domain-containing protein [Deltaproteobacteria bacterium]TMQ06603.1 MAG: PEGA domain-containing protein [Deltaproteobacteria bacterium]